MERIKILRKKKGLTQVELAQLLNVKHAAVSKYERGDIQPSKDILLKLANILECSTDYLLEITNIPNPSANPSDFIIQTTPNTPFEKLEDLPKDAQDKIMEYYEMMVEKHLKKS